MAFRYTKELSHEQQHELSHVILTLLVSGSALVDVIDAQQTLACVKLAKAQGNVNMTGYSEC